MSIAVHRNTDSRSCGARTNVAGNRNVFANNLLVSVKDDPNSHGGGSLKADNNDGTVFVNNRLVVLLGSSASPDSLCPIPGGPHCNPKSSSASPNVFACHGPKGGGISEGPDPTGEDLAALQQSDNNTSAQSSTSSSTGSGGGSSGTLTNTNTAPSTSGSSNTTEDSRERQAERGGPSNVVPPAELENDAAFQAKLDEMIAKYPGLTREEIYSIMQGESGFDSRAVNGSTGATGLFQFMPATARELGYTTAQIQNMTPAEQLEVYDQYLDRWNYDGSNHLGIMQAAPAYASRSGGSIIYARGSAAWRQNPGWRPADGGDITVDSINNYYRGQA